MNRSGSPLLHRDFVRIFVLAISVVLLAPLIAACSMKKMPAGIVTTDKPVCTVWKGISYSAKRDTPETVAEVRANNAARTEYCK